MSNFRGYLLKFGDTIFPNKYIDYESFKSHPDQRLEIEAYRDANALLHRVTSPSYKTKLEFNTRGNINLYEKEEIFNIIHKGLIPGGEVERKHKLQYWNDDISNYVDGIYTFYMPDTEYTIRSITENGEYSNIIYKSIRIAFIQY